MGRLMVRAILPVALATSYRGLLVDLVDRSVGQRRHVEVAVGARDDVRADPEVLARDQSFALPLVELVVVVVDLVFQSRVAEGEVLPALIESELEQIAAGEEGPRGAHEEVPGVLGSEPAAREADRRGSHGPLPAELGVVVMGT